MSTSDTPPPAWVGGLVQWGSDGGGGTMLVLRVNAAGWCPPRNPAADPARLAQEVADRARGLPALVEARGLEGQLRAVWQAAREVADRLNEVARERRDGLTRLEGEARAARLRRCAEEEASLSAQQASLQKTLAEVRAAGARARQSAEWAVKDLAAQVVQQLQGTARTPEDAMRRFLQARGVGEALAELAAHVRTPAVPVDAVAERAQRLLLAEGAPPAAPAGPPPAQATQVYAVDADGRETPVAVATAFGA
jgi:hypothetical protein